MNYAIEITRMLMNCYWQKGAITATKYRVAHILSIQRCLWEEK